MAGFDISGIQAGLREAEERMKAGAVDGLGLWAEYVLEESSRLVPIEEGTLLRSGTTQVNAGDLSAAVGYGKGASSAYAVRQHYDMSYSHDSGRQALYLEQPAIRSAAKAQELISRAIKAKMG